MSTRKKTPAVVAKKTASPKKTATPKKTVAAAKKPAAKAPKGMAKSLPSGITMNDLFKKNWKLGPVIGQGGFGFIYLGGKDTPDEITPENAENVIKVEPHSNGPLFSELAFYRRVAKKPLMSDWMKNNKRAFLGVPQYIAEGSFYHEELQYRFMVMERFGTDIEKVFDAAGKQFTEETAFSLGLRVLEALEYIHDLEYVHADIKSSNLMMGWTKSTEKQVFLLDYGLAYRYCPEGRHKPYKEDPKRKHDGTLQYCSIDAHKGVAPSRRSDLEILSYVMLEWLCGSLPWSHIQSDKLVDKETVMKMKIKYMDDADSFMKTCFKSGKGPDNLKKFIEQIHKLEYEERPDYEKLRALFRDGLKKAGYSDDGKSVILPRSHASGKRRSIASQELASPAGGKKSKPSTPAELKPAASKATPSSSRSRAKLEIEVPSTPRSRAKLDKVPSSRTPLNPLSSSEDVKTSSSRRGTAAKRTAAATKSSKENVDQTTVVSMSDSGTDRVVYKRPRRKNVPTRDFGQSP